ncbi:hypothetical protein C8F01DRAFT_1089836 [Mycena amicta]|nr:hypothetical protein C8F01DRAFT_1089836 [Mycena amicta]
MQSCYFLAVVPFAASRSIRDWVLVPAAICFSKLFQSRPSELCVLPNSASQQPPSLPLITWCLITVPAFASSRWNLKPPPTRRTNYQNSYQKTTPIRPSERPTPPGIRVLMLPTAATISEILSKSPRRSGFGILSDSRSVPMITSIACQYQAASWPARSGSLLELSNSFNSTRDTLTKIAFPDMGKTSIRRRRTCSKYHRQRVPDRQPRTRKLNQKKEEAETDTVQRRLARVQSLPALSGSPRRLAGALVKRRSRRFSSGNRSTGHWESGQGRTSTPCEATAASTSRTRMEGSVVHKGTTDAPRNGKSLEDESWNEWASTPVHKALPGFREGEEKPENPKLERSYQELKAR